MRFVVELDPAPIEFTEAGSGGEYPYLAKVSAIRSVARVASAIGLDENESPNAAVTLDNVDRVASRELGDALRARATIYSDADEIEFEGAITRIEYGDALVVEIDA